MTRLSDVEIDAPTDSLDRATREYAIAAITSADRKGGKCQAILSVQLLTYDGVLPSIGGAKRCLTASVAGLGRDDLAFRARPLLYLAIVLRVAARRVGNESLARSLLKIGVSLRTYRRARQWYVARFRRSASVLEITSAWCEYLSWAPAASILKSESSARGRRHRRWGVCREAVGRSEVTLADRSASRLECVQMLAASSRVADGQSDCEC